MLWSEFCESVAEVLMRVEVMSEMVKVLKLSSLSLDERMVCLKVDWTGFNLSAEALKWRLWCWTEAALPMAQKDGRVGTKGSRVCAGGAVGCNSEGKLARLT